MVMAWLTAGGWNSTFFVIGIVVLFVVLTIAFYQWLFPKFLKKRLEANRQLWLMEDYSRHWRARLFRMAQGSHETLEIHAARIEAICSRKGQSDLSNTIQHFMRQDSGLCLFAAVRTVLR